MPSGPLVRPVTGSIVTVPLAFQAAAESTYNLESRVRRTCRDTFHAMRLLDRILPDIDQMLGITAGELAAGEEADADPARPERWWSPGEADGDDGYARDDPGDSSDRLAR